MPDIVELILADHMRIRELLGGLGDMAGDGKPGNDRFAKEWEVLAGLLEVHLDAAEEIAYPALFSGPAHGARPMMPGTVLATVPSRRRAAAHRPAARRSILPAQAIRTAARCTVARPSQVRPRHARAPGEVDCSSLVIASPAVSLAKITSIAVRCGSDRRRPRLMRRKSHCRRYGNCMSRLLG